MTKIALVIDKRGSNFGFVASCLLKKKYNVKLYDINCFKKDEYFFRMQKELEYEPLIVKEELESMAKKEQVDLPYIRALEEEYGKPHLWPYVWADKGIMGQHSKYSLSFPGPSMEHEEILKRLQVCFREISRAIDEKKPDCIIFETIGGLEMDILHELAERRGIKILHPSFPRIKNTTLFIDNSLNEFTEAYQIFDSIRQGLYKSSCATQAKKVLLEFREAPSRHRYFIPNSKTPLLKRIARNILYFWRAARGSSKHNDFLNYLKKRLIMLHRKTRGFGGIFEETKDGEDFAYFPLHQEPELATLLYAPFFTNQIALIQNISKSLPVNFKLYVKEQPEMLYHRPLSYYKELKKLPNIRLISHKTDSILLIKKAKLVLTITGTAGWEAAMLSKPVITFGQVFYNKLSSVKYSPKPEDLPLVIKESLEAPAISDEEVVDFLSAIFEKSINFDYMYIWEASLKELAEYEQLEGFVDALAKKLKLDALNEV